MKIFYNQDSSFLLIKVVFGKKIGFSQYHEIKDLNYPSESEVLEEITQTKRHFLITNAYLDAFEFSNQYIKDNLLFKNHSLFYKDQFYRFSDILKLKLTGDLDQDITLISDYDKQFKKLRLDCNNKYTDKSFKLLLKNINKEKIEYIEDPFPFNLSLYNKLDVPIAIDHLYNLSPNPELFCNFKVIYRPTINPNDKRAFESIFSNQFEGILGAWHSFCYLRRMGDINKVQGIYNPFTQQLYSQGKQHIQIKKDVVQKEYRRLRRLTWTKLKI
jgi:uncharacterized membrane protein YobD (UPF0266 family)